MPSRVGRRRGGAGAEGGDAATERLKAQVTEGPQAAYEALQTARALFARWESQGQGGRARAMGLELARAFAEARELKAALDLARLYMANNSTRAAASPADNDGGKRVTELTPQEAQRARQGGDATAAASTAADPAMAEHRFASGGRDKMLALASLMPQGSGERLSVLKGAARWAAEETGKGVPDTELLLALAAAYREAGDYGHAAQRLATAAAAPDADADAGTLLAGPAQAYASLLAEWAGKGYRGEADLFLARAAVHILSLAPGPPLDPAAATAAAAYAKQVLEAVAAGGGPLAAALQESPLAHFVLVLVELIQHRKPGAPEAFQLLAERYRPSIERDPDGIGRAVGRIAELYFGIRPPPNPMQALLQSMLGGMGGGDGMGGGGLLGRMLGGGAGGGGGLLGALGGMGGLGL